MAKDTPTLARLVNQWKIDPVEKQRLLQIIAGWKLARWEEDLVYRLVAYATGAESAAVAEWGEWVRVLRGSENGIVKFAYAEMEQISWNGPALRQESFRRRLACTVYWALNVGDVPTAMSIREKLEYASASTLEFDDLPDDLNDWYRRLYLIICFQNFNILPNFVRLFIISSPLLVLSFQIGFDFETSARDLLNGFVDFGVRQDTARQLAVFLLDNQTSLGRKSAEEAVTVNYWIEKFRVYSRGNFGGMDLVNFIGDKNFTGFCTVEDKDLILSVVGLYTRLVNGSLIVPDGDVDAIVKLALEVEKEDDRDSGVAVPDKVDFAVLLGKPIFSDWDRQTLRAWLKKQPDLLELKDVVLREVQKLDWANEPYISNLLELSDLMNKYFGPGGILVYFDEAQGKFVLNKE
ncbi:MAG: hypothetical protein WCV41_04890 [Patescibacteria group bacterium]